MPDLSAICQQIEFAPGMQVDRYILEQKIGVGGMGTVYLARHARLTSRFYAIKFIRPELVSRDIRQRFEAEIDALEKIQHPNFVFAHDAGDFNNVIYLVMEYVNGLSLSQILEENGPLPVQSAAEIVRQTATGLQHAFEQELVHRDIKPSNIILTKDGIVKILDLGLARFVNQDANHGLTGSYQILGTPDYMSPEQCRSAASVDIRSDIYSLGCTLYRLVAGRAPFADENHSSIANKIAGHLAEQPSPIQSVSDQKLPEKFISVLDKMMAKNPDQRYQTPAEVQDAIEPFASISSFDSLNTTSSFDVVAHTNTKSLKASSVATDATKAPASLIIEKQPPKGIPILWITGVLGIFLLIALAWSMSGTGKKNDGQNSPTVALNAGNQNEINGATIDSTKEYNKPASEANETKGPKETSESQNPESSPAEKSTIENKDSNDSPNDSLTTNSESPENDDSDTSVKTTNESTSPKETIAKRRTVPKPTSEELASSVKQIFRNR